MHFSSFKYRLTSVYWSEMQKNRIQSALIQHCAQISFTLIHIPQPTALIQHLYTIHWWNICYPTSQASKTCLISYQG